MANDPEVQAKRERIAALRAEVQEEKNKAAAENLRGARDAKVASLDVEEANLQAELAALRASAPQPTPAPRPAKTSSNDAADNKE